MPTKFFGNKLTLALRGSAAVGALVGLLTLAGCSGGEPAPIPPPTTVFGDLNAGHFHYECASRSDDSCTPEVFQPISLLFPQDSSNYFPTAVAVGALFDVTYVPQQSRGVLVSVAPASTDFVQRENGFLRVKKAGTVDLVAHNRIDDSVLDFTRMDLKEPTGLRAALDTSAPGTSYPYLESFDLFRLKLGKTAAVLAVPRDHDSLLGGSLEYSWTSSDEEVIQLEAPTISPDWKVTAKKAGQSTLTVVAKDATNLTTSITIEVAP